LLIGFLVGVFVGKDIQTSWQAAGFLIIALAFFSFIFYKTKLLYIGMFLLFVSLGTGYYWFYAQRISKPVLIGQKDFVATVVNDPIRQGESQKLMVNGDMGKVLISTRSYPEYIYGDKLKISGDVKKPGIINNFDYGQYLERYGVTAIMLYPQIEKLSSGNGSYVYFWLISANHCFIDSISSSISEPESALLSAILVGARKALPQNIIDNFQTTGLTHIIAISGYNVTIVVVAVWWLLRYFGRKWAFVGSLILVLGFVIFTGASASVTRGGLVAMLAILAKYVGRRTNPSLLIALSATLMILGNALILRDDVGFALSFLAFAGLIYLSPHLQILFNSWGKPMAVKNILAETLSAQIFVLPILIVKFSIFSLIAPIANILILPLIPLVMIIGFDEGFFGLFLSPLAQIIGWFNWLLLHYILKTTEILAKIPFASIQCKLSTIWYIPYYLLVVLAIFLLKRKYAKNQNS
jgi:competence protein ComEC